MGIFSRFFGSSKNDQLNDFKERAALVVDVRSSSEYKGGHVSGSINIPLPQINNKIDFLRKKNKPIVLCCASGMRSRSAAKTLSAQNIECMNGGSWMSVNSIFDN